MKTYIQRRCKEADTLNAVIEAYEATRDGKTADTVNRLVETMGREGAAVAVATLVNAVSIHDGRISDRNREWAQSMNGAPSNEELHTVGIYGVDSWIHSAHVDNLANAWRRYERENPPTEPEQTEETQTETEPTEAEQIAAVIAAADLHIAERVNRSAWARGVALYASELLDDIAEALRGGWLSLDDLMHRCDRQTAMLNGARDWSQYSWGGCSLIYDSDIAERLCTPSELKKTRHGDRRPNATEEWLDVQARALFQASNRVSQALAAALAEMQKNDRATASEPGTNRPGFNVDPLKRHVTA